MATVADYHSALTSFIAAPGEATKAAVLAARAALPDMVSMDGATVTLPNLSTLEASCASIVAGVARTDTRRFIRVGFTHGS